jgi:hypothetical protein
MLQASFLAAFRMRRLAGAAADSGVLSAAAVLYKPPAALPALGIGGLLGIRALHAGGSVPERCRRLLSTLAVHLLAGSLTLAVPVAYFAWHGALNDLWEVLILLSLSHSPSAAVPLRVGLSWGFRTWLVDNGWWGVPLLAASVGGAISAARRRDWRALRGSGASALMLLLALGSVAWQRKYFRYHYVVAVPFLLACAAYGIAEAMRYRPRLVVAAVVVLVGVGALMAAPWPSQIEGHAAHPTGYPHVAAAAVRHAFGRLSRERFLEPFVAAHRYSYADQEDLGLIVRRRARAGDRMVVRGFEPAVYVVAGLPCPSRFAAEHFLFSSHLSYKRKQWIAEHEEALRRDPPRFAVYHRSGDGAPTNPLPPEYTQIATRGHLLLFERVPAETDADRSVR